MFLRKNRVKITIAINLPLIHDTTAWLGYLFGLGPLFGYGESSGELLGGRVGFLHQFAWHHADGHLGLHRILSRHSYEAVRGHSACPST